MTKKKSAKKAMGTPFDIIENSTVLEAYDALDDRMMADEMMTEVFNNASSFIRAEQDAAIELTKLAVAHAKDANESTVFKLYEKAIKVVKKGQENILNSL